MQIKDLAQLDIKDLKNIDYSIILEGIKKRPDIIIETVLVLAVIFFCISYHSNRKKDFSALKTELSKMESKEKIFDEHQEMQQVLKELQSVLPKDIKEAQLIEIVTANAGKNYITITSFSPAKHETYDVYDKITLSFNLTSESYEDMFDFVYALETQMKTLRISSWTGQSQLTSSRQIRMRRMAEHNAQNNTISSSLTLTAINFKND